MESKDGTRSSVSRKKGTDNLKRNAPVFAFFLLLSFVLWYLNSLGKDLETDIKYPVRYMNIPPDRALASGTPAHLSLVLKGPGYSILQLKITGNRYPVEVDLSKINLRHHTNGKWPEYYLLTSDLVQNFNAQLKAGCKIISVKPDTLGFLSVRTK